MIQGAQGRLREFADLGVNREAFQFRLEPGHADGGQGVQGAFNEAHHGVDRSMLRVAGIHRGQAPGPTGADDAGAVATAATAATAADFAVNIATAAGFAVRGATAADFAFRAATAADFAVRIATATGTGTGTATATGPATATGVVVVGSLRGHDEHRVQTRAPRPRFLVAAGGGAQADDLHIGGRCGRRARRGEVVQVLNGDAPSPACPQCRGQSAPARPQAAAHAQIDRGVESRQRRGQQCGGGVGGVRPGDTRPGRTGRGDARRRGGDQTPDPRGGIRRAVTRRVLVGGVLGHGRHGTMVDRRYRADKTFPQAGSPLYGLSGAGRGHIGPPAYHGGLVTPPRITG